MSTRCPWGIWKKCRRGYHWSNLHSQLHTNESCTFAVKLILQKVLTFGQAARLRCWRDPSLESCSNKRVMLGSWAAVKISNDDIGGKRNPALVIPLHLEMSRDTKDSFDGPLSNACMKRKWDPEQLYCPLHQTWEKIFREKVPGISHTHIPKATRSYILLKAQRWLSILQVKVI